MKNILFALCLLFGCDGAQAQIVSFRDTIADYNLTRVKINLTGERILGVWGIANIATGSIGYASAKEDQWKYFHAMNAGWGAVNTLLAGGGMLYAYRQLHNRPGFDKAYLLYRNNKRAYLISSGVDVALIIGGAAMARNNTNTSNGKEAMLAGFGKSITMQGVALLIFDNVMYASHLRNNSNWFRIMNEIHLSGNGIGFNHTF